MNMKKCVQQQSPDVWRPTQENIDALAAFVEVVEDLAAEPFMGEDENGSMRKGGGEPVTYSLGDRTHFRSALISFRRIWMQGEPTYYKTIGGLLHCYRPHSGLAGSFVKDIRQLSKNKDYFIQGIKNEDIIDIWINTVFAHSGLDKNKSVNRNTFDSFVQEHGLGKFEWAFRMSVRIIALQFINLCAHEARPILKEWIEKFGSPSFKISSPFGRKIKEISDDGSIIIKQASSKYFSEESIEKKFNRILKRNKFSTLKFIWDVLDASESGKVILLLKFEKFLDLLKELEFEYKELPEGSRYDENTIRLFDDASSSAILERAGELGSRLLEPLFINRHQRVFHATCMGIEFINNHLLAFRNAFMNDA